MTKPWKRLGPWLPGGEPPNDGDAALRALADVTEVRRSLEQAELVAVRIARRHRKSWTEIATMLTISRQSAWERWRVKLWLERGDGEAGVREPRRPTTPPRAARGRRDEHADQAVG